MNSKKIIIKEGDKIIEIIALNALQGELKIPHHLTLLLASICNVYFYLKHTQSPLFSHTLLHDAIKRFKGLSHRFECIPPPGAYTIINDSSASTPESVLLALEVPLPEPVVLLMGGGNHKNLSFDNVVKKIIKKKIYVVLLENDSTSLLIKNHFVNKKYKKYTLISSFKEAVVYALSVLKKSERGSLLLSPGCSGAPYFKDMFERGNLFKKYINEQFSITNN